MTPPDDKLPDVWVSRHGGEPVALLAAIDKVDELQLLAATLEKLEP